jgi:predicted nucleic acid-binding protein
MSKLFVDTSGWASLFHPDDLFHVQAESIYKDIRKQGTRLVTTNYIIAETVALLTSPFRTPRQAVIDFVNSIKTSALVDIVHIDAGLDDRAWDFLSIRADKKWSLVDCSSFVVMNEYGIIDVLTNDHNFEQAGFVRLLK